MTTTEDRNAKRPRITRANRARSATPPDDRAGPGAEAPAPPQQLVMLRPESPPLPLDAYLASALTGLDDHSRQLVFHVSDAIQLICEEYGINLYEPRKKTDPVYNRDMPDAEVFALDREKVLNSDLLIHLCHFPSTGSGQELDFAYTALVPMILISHESRTVSRMITGIPSLQFHIRYEEPEELRAQLHDLLGRIRPLLEERKLAFSNYDANIVGANIQQLRETLGISREDVAGKVQISVDALRVLEESSDRTANHSLVHLRRIATVLGTTVADLVEPDANGRMVNAVQDWLERRTAARFGGAPASDRNKVLRRALLHIIDSLDEGTDDAPTSP